MLTLKVVVNSNISFSIYLGSRLHLRNLRSLILGFLSKLKHHKSSGLNNFIKFFPLAILIMPSILLGYDASPPCYKELQLNFFKYEYLGQALSYHYIPQSDWQATYNDLKQASAAIPSQIKASALRYPRNPLDHPFMTKESAEILRDALYQTFVAVMRRHSFTVESDIQNMFQFIAKSQYSTLQRCFGEDAQIFIK